MSDEELSDEEVRAGLKSAAEWMGVTEDGLKQSLAGEHARQVARELFMDAEKALRIVLEEYGKKAMFDVVARVVGTRPSNTPESFAGLGQRLLQLEADVLAIKGTADTYRSTTRDALGHTTACFQQHEERLRALELAFRELHDHLTPGNVTPMADGSLLAGREEIGHGLKERLHEILVQGGPA